MHSIVKPAPKSLNTMRLSLAASLLVLTQMAMAANEIGITPYQRQLNINNTGIITLKFELENRSGNLQQLQENISLPAGWQLISNTAPFTLNNGARDVRLVHISPPKGTPAGNYVVAYQITALGNGSLNNQEAITIQLQGQAGLKLEAQSAPSNLIAGEEFTVDFLLENTGNKTISYKLDAYDTEGFIQALTPKQITLTSGESKLIQVRGKVRSKISKTIPYTLKLQARGGGVKTEQTISTQLIARTPEGIGKYQKLPGKLKASYSIEPGNKHNDQDSWLAQLEYFGRGQLDRKGEHNLEVKLRNGQQQQTYWQTDQLEEYYLAYWNDELKVQTGHQSFSTNYLTGNHLSGLGAAVTYNPKNKQGKRPLKIQAFYGQTRSGEKKVAKSVYAALNYNWENYELQTSILEYQKNSEKRQTIHTIGGTWRGQHLTAHTSVASDNNKKHAYTGELVAQWENLGFNTSITRADNKFAGGISDALQMYSNLNYQLDARNTFSTRVRKTRNNLDNNKEYEIRDGQDLQIRFSHHLNTENPTELTLGYRISQEQDLRQKKSNKRTTQAAVLEYQQQFESIALRASAELGKRTEQDQTSLNGSSQEISLSWQPQHNLKLGTNYALNQELDNTGKTYSFGLNGQYQFTPRSQLTGYIQRSQKDETNDYSQTYNLEYQHDFRQNGQITFSASQIETISAKLEDNQKDQLLKLEYSLPLDLPLYKRDNIGSLEGHITTAEGQPANDVILQLDSQYAVTDQQGKFSYPDIIAKDYQLTIDSSRPNSTGLVFDNSNPKNTIKVSADQLTRANLVVQKGAQLKGQLLRYTVDTAAALEGDQQALKADQGIAMVVVELHPIGEPANRIIHRRSTLYDGSFSFIGIPPGQWELLVIDSKRIPDKFRLEQTRFMLDLMPGATNNKVLIRALPTAQTIKKAGPQKGFEVSG